MNDLLPVYSQRAFLLFAIRVLAGTVTESKKLGMSSLLEDCLVSLVFEEMCRIVQVQGRAGFRHQGTVLQQAIEQIERDLYLSTPEQWLGYWRRISETLKYPANQLQELQSRLIANQRERALEYQRLEEGVDVPFEILHVPELGALLAAPLSESFYLDWERVQAQAGWGVAGESYPFEIHVEDLTFVVALAGEVIVFIRNFPDSLVRQVTERLKEIAQVLYTQRGDDFREWVTVKEDVEPYPLEGEGE